jgi:hypothetical protein
MKYMKYMKYMRFPPFVTKHGNLFPVTLVLLLITACADGAMPGAADQEAAKARRAEAEAMFQERCRKAGEFVHRTAENVEGIFLLKLRPGDVNPRDQYGMDDPYGRDRGGDLFEVLGRDEEAYIKSFLLGRNESGGFSDTRLGGYAYVDAVDPRDGQRYRYTAGFREVARVSAMDDGKTSFTGLEFVLDRTPAPDPAPRYGVTYDDISTREERDYWIAGSSLRVIDLASKEVMAERVGYMMSRYKTYMMSRYKTSWLLAVDHACPRFGPEKTSLPRTVYQAFQTRNFVEKVLKPGREK